MPFPPQIGGPPKVANLRVNRYLLLSARSTTPVSPRDQSSIPLTRSLKIKIKIIKISVVFNTGRAGLDIADLCGSKIVLLN